VDPLGRLDVVGEATCELGGVGQHDGLPGLRGTSDGRRGDLTPSAVLAIFKARCRRCRNALATWNVLTR
jgi:hypothetical protein